MAKKRQNVKLAAAIHYFLQKQPYESVNYKTKIHKKVNRNQSHSLQTRRNQSLDILDSCLFSECRTVF